MSLIKLDKELEPPQEQMRDYQMEHETSIRNASNSLMSGVRDHIDPIDLNCLLPDVMFPQKQMNVLQIQSTMPNQQLGTFQQQLHQQQPSITSPNDLLSPNRKRRLSQSSLGDECAIIMNSSCYDPQSISSTIRQDISIIKPEPGIPHIISLTNFNSYYISFDI